MLANFLGKSKPINFIILLSLFVCLFIFSSFLFIYNNNFELAILVKSASYLGIFLIIFFFFNFIVSKNNLTFDNTYAFFVFTIVLSYFLQTTNNYKTLITILLHILFLRKVYSLKSQKHILQKLFDSGFWLSILFIIAPFSAMFSILIYAAIFSHQKPIINNLIAPIIGFITPLLIYATYCFWFDKLYVFTNLFYFDTFNSFVFYSENSVYWPTILIIVLSIVAIFLKSPKALSVNNSFKKSWILLIINLTIALFFALFIPKKNGTELLFMLFPAAIIIANGLETINNTLIKNIVFILLLLTAVTFPFFL
ncbi:DUF6427 family protein [Polaribacter sp. PL03]|uniref:DUF6427 family protein n=1 Tax=Polaribacter sp. PL03 TaxID=3088353 RepID=UPI0029D3FC7E|nr:DUF6427 family protein [Polaribacter sp. PL03]MDX6745351.1 DUF6427 family protein [Polaribacter sp. PL03]